MDVNKLFNGLAQLDHIGELDVLLEARERLRRTFAYFTDAYNTTGNAVFLDYRDRILAAGILVNEELARLTTDIAMNKGSDRFGDVGKSYHGGV